MRAWIIAGLGAALLAGCAQTEVTARPPEGYVQDVGARVSAVDWSKARSQMVKLDEFSFAPETLVFEHGQPYRLSLENVGNRSHTFTSQGFFKDIAARRVTTPQNTVETPALVNLEVPAHQTYVVEFVPIGAGTFELTCDEPLHSMFGMTGKITVR